MALESDLTHHQSQPVRQDHVPHELNRERSQSFAPSSRPARSKSSLCLDSETDRDDNEKKPFPSLDTTSGTLPVPTADHLGSNNLSPAGHRADASRLDDDLELLRAERLISHQEHQDPERHRSTRHRRATEVEDTFNSPVQTDPKPIKRRDKDAALYRFWLFLKKFPRFVRYFVYLIPGATLLLTPILISIFAVDQSQNPVGGTGGTYLFWFGIWLEIVWGSLWVTRMITSLMPRLFQGTAKVIGSINSKKWREVGQDMELHTAIFLWMLAVLVSFKPTCDGHRVPIPDGQEEDAGVMWIDIVFKIIIAFFVLATLNFLEKILIQWIAAAFHERTYATRIENNKGDIRQLIQLFEHAKNQLHATDPFWQPMGRTSPSSAQTPMRALQNAQRVLGKVGQVAGRVGNDFIGRKVDANHPKKVVAELLRTTSSSHTLARLIYRSLVSTDHEMVFLDDVKKAFKTDEEAEAAFNVFDKDLNGDISMEEFEAVASEIALEKKAIAASLKDLDSVIKKLDKVFLTIIVIIVIIVFISIISGSAAAALASAGSSILGLAWMLQATAQEFLQSIIFVFIKHPFDVGDRVTIYGNTGATLTGDDYYVTEISLLYTEFKKLQGHVVQAPNSLLNTLFILNQRRSNGLADPIPLQIRFGTPSWMLEELKQRMLEFCIANNRDYQPEIITELSKIEEMRSATWTIVFIHKSNFQNEMLRLGRHNKFMMELMYQLHKIGIQSPYRIEPGGSRENPLYWNQKPDNPPRTPTGPPGSTDGPGPLDSIDAIGPPAPSNLAQPAFPLASPRRPSASACSVRQMCGTTESTLNNVHDVFEGRRDHFMATRLASIREKDRAEKIRIEGEKEEEAETRASTTALAPASSLGSMSRSRIFSRPRTRSQSRVTQSQSQPLPFAQPPSQSQSPHPHPYQQSSDHIV